MSLANWEVYDYEVAMFQNMLSLCRNGDYKRYPEPIQNAVVESLLIHIRILIEILLDRDKEADAVRLETLLPKFTSTKIGELDATYGKRNIPGCPYWTINKRLAHSTNIRVAGFDYMKTINAVSPLILSLVSDVDNERRTRGLR
jgi:hypothetical protein